MEVEFEVKMTSKVLYDYMLHHMYTSLTGIFGTMVGIFMVTNFILNRNVVSLILGLAIIIYLPWTLFLKSKQQMLNTPEFSKPLHYKMTDEGVEVSQGEEVQMQKWEDMVKAVSTKGSIILYTSKVNASIFPRKDLRELTPNVIEMISTHMPPNKLKIKA